MLVTRFAERRVASLVRAFRIVIVNGARQSGKTTLLRQFHESHNGTFRSLDAAETLALARADATAFAAAGRAPRIIDEVQRGGEPLVLAIKYLVGRDPALGQSILSGSARLLRVPRLSESMAGRAASVDFWRFAAAERVGAPAHVPDRLCTGEAGAGSVPAPCSRQQ